MISLRSRLVPRAVMLGGCLPWLLLLTAGFLPTTWAADVPSRLISYQGRLTQSGDPADGAFNFQFNLFDVPVGGAVLATVVQTNIMVDQGLFTVRLDLDPSVLAQGTAWLEIGIEPADSAENFEVIEPRQPITAVPYALYSPFATESDWAQTARQTAPGAVTSAAIVDQAITAPKIAPGIVVRSLNGRTDDIKLVAGTNIDLVSTPGGFRISAAIPEADSHPIANTIWVDPVNGDDSTARRGLMDRPWLSLSNALAAVQDGDRLVIRPGVYLVERLGMPENSGSYFLEHQHAPLLLENRTGITVDAEGAIIVATGLGSVLSIVDCTHLTVRGLTFKGPGANAPIPDEIAGEIVLWGTNSNVMFDRCQFEDFPNHGILMSQNEKSSYDTTVRDCFFRRGGTLQHGQLGVDGAAVASLGPGLKVMGCTFEDVARGIEVEGSYNTKPIGPVLIANNLMRNIWSAGIIIIPGNYNYLNDIRINDNMIFGDLQVRPGAVYQIGILAYGGCRISVLGNNVGRCANDGILLRGLAPLVDVSVCQNNCWENGARNIAVEHRYNQVRGGVISGNLCLRNGQGPSIEVAGENVSVIGNTLIDSAGPGIRVSAVPGFSSPYVLVSGNRLSGGGPDLISIGAGVQQAVVRDNLATMPDPQVVDEGLDTQVDEAFLDRSRSHQSSALQKVAEAAQILPNAYNIRVAGLEGAVTLTSTPSILPGQDGQMLCILGTADDDTVSLQDQGVLANSGLGLGVAARTLSRGDILTLRYEEADATWWEVSFSDKPALLAQ